MSDTATKGQVARLDAIDAELRELSCRYVVKGRPAAMKQGIRSADPVLEGARD